MNAQDPTRSLHEILHGSGYDDTLSLDAVDMPSRVQADVEAMDDVDEDRGGPQHYGERKPRKNWGGKMLRAEVVRALYESSTPYALGKQLRVLDSTVGLIRKGKTYADITTGLTLGKTVRMIAAEKAAKGER